MAAMPTVAAPIGPPPTNELGAPGLSSWAGWVDGWEDTAELRFPNSVRVYDRMRRSDGQVDAVIRACDLPIRQARWQLSTAGVDPRVIRFVLDELGIDLDRNTAGRRRRRGQGVVFSDMLRHALIARWLGFMPFEQVYNVAPPAPGQSDLGLPAQTAHLAKLAPRMPRSITRIDVATDGGLEAIRQLVPRSAANGTNGTASIVGEVIIPADRLVMFCQDREGGDWTGRSNLRSSYGHWLIKSALLKLGPMIAERNGMGVPVVTFGASHSKQEATAIARNLRAGEEAGVALPDGMTVSLLGVTGTLRDELPLLQYHDQAIGRSALAMFLNLGHDRGAQSLGSTFVDFFLRAEQATTTDIEDTVTEYVIRDLVELNYGPDEPYPRLVADELAADQPATAEGLKSLVDAGLLDADADVKAEVRRRYRMPHSDHLVDSKPPAPSAAPGSTTPDPAANPGVTTGHEPSAANPAPAKLSDGTVDLAAIAQRAADVAARVARLAGATD